MLSPIEMMEIAVKALDDKKAKDIRVFKITNKSVLADYFIICNGTSSTHNRALIDEVEKQLDEAGESAHKREGQRSDIWVLIDFGCVVVHVFTEEARKFYDLERLWSDAEEVDPSSLLRP